VCVWGGGGGGGGGCYQVYFVTKSLDTCMVIPETWYETSGIGVSFTRVNHLISYTLRLPRFSNSWLLFLWPIDSLLFPSPFSRFILLLFLQNLPLSSPSSPSPHLPFFSSSPSSFLLPRLSLFPLVIASIFLFPSFSSFLLPLDVLPLPSSFPILLHCFLLPLLSSFPLTHIFPSFLLPPLFSSYPFNSLFFSFFHSYRPVFSTNPSLLLFFPSPPPPQAAENRSWGGGGGKGGVIFSLCAPRVFPRRCPPLGGGAPPPPPPPPGRLQRSHRDCAGIRGHGNVSAYVRRNVSPHISSQ